MQKEAAIYLKIMKLQRRKSKHFLLNSMSTLKKSKIEKSQRKDLDKELEECRKQAEENLIGWQRAKADFVNYKKDQEKYLDEFRKYAKEDVVIKLLPTIDSFDLAIQHMPDNMKDSDWAKGIVCIKSQFNKFLEEAGVEKIKSIGEKFDPELFESVGEEESEKEEGIVVAEIQKGYKMFDKVIRPAKVKVAKRKS
jgi:molecular chaperone GrpE (heat shock protein)